MTRAVLTDTHALVWAAGGQTRRLSSRARSIFAAADQGLALIYVSVVSLIEIAEGVHAGRMALDSGYERWLDALFGHEQYRMVELTTAHARRAHGLYAIPERDDRLLAATALELDCPLLTRDAAIGRSGLVRTLW